MLSQNITLNNYFFLRVQNFKLGKKNTQFNQMDEILASLNTKSYAINV